MFAYLLHMAQSSLISAGASKLLQPDHLRERGDISERAAKNDPTSQRILKLFGPKSQSTIYLPKRNGHEVRPLGVLSHQRRTNNDEWVSPQFTELCCRCSVLSYIPRQRWCWVNRLHEHPNRVVTLSISMV